MTVPGSDLLNAAARSLALAGVVAMGLMLLRVQARTARLRIWTGVLYAALAMPLLLALTPGWRLVLPLRAALPAPRATPAAAPVSLSSLPVLPVVVGEAPSTAAVEVVTASPIPVAPSRPVVNWREAALLLYLLLGAALLARMGLGWLLMQRLWRRAQPISDGDLGRMADELARKLGLRATPRLLTSARTAVPAALGVWRPVVVLPASWAAWSADKQRAVLAHEFAHIARADAWAQRLSLLHRAVFWFSPLGWWLHRRLLTLAEEASDEAVLRLGAGREEYAEVLLDFLRELRAPRSGMAWEGVAMARVHGPQAERRIDRILSWQAGEEGENAMTQSKSRTFLMAMAIVPLAVALAALQPVVTAQTPVPPTAPPPQAVTPPAPPAPVAPVITPAPEAPEPPPAGMHVLAPAVAPLPPDPPTPIAAMAYADVAAAYAPMAPPAGFDQDAQANWSDATITVGEHVRNQAYSWDNFRGGDCGHYSYDSDNGLMVAIGDCAMPDLPADQFTWWARITPSEIDYHSGANSTRITDAATLAQARQLFQPMLQLEAQQRELGRQQRTLGAQQRALGEQQRTLGRQQRDASAPVDKVQLDVSLKQVQADLDALNGEATQVELGRLQNELSRLQSELGRLQSAAGREQSSLGAQQSQLGAQQSALGRQQSELGRQQSDLGRQSSAIARDAAGKLHALLDAKR